VDDGPDAVENSSKPVHDTVDSPVNKLGRLPAYGAWPAVFPSTGCAEEKLPQSDQDLFERHPKDRRAAGEV